MKDTKYELLAVIANQGCTELIMDAAREQQAGMRLLELAGDETDE